MRPASSALLVALTPALAIGCATSPPPRAPATVAVPEVEAAIATMKGIVPSRLTKEQRSAKDAALDAAWKTLASRHDVAPRRLSEELAMDERAATPDHFFRMDASGLLWDLQGIQAASAIARALQGVDLGMHMDVGFQMFVKAASTRDARAWPVIEHALRLDEQSGQTFFAAHFMEVRWPLILYFIFAPYGPHLCDAVASAAKASTDRRVRRSASAILADSFCLEGLPLWRRWAAEDQGDLGFESLMALGHLAHPDDRDRLIAATRDPSPLRRRAAAYGLFEYGDPATAPALRALLDDPNEDVRLEAIAGVFHLVDADGARAIVAVHRRAKAGSREAELIDKLLGELTKVTGTKPAPLLAGDELEWKRALELYWKHRDRFFELRADDRRLSRGDFERALAIWEKEGRIAGGEFEWIETRQVLAVATPEDLPRLMSVRGRILMRQSDEALDEIGIWTRIIQILHRRRLGTPKPNE